MELIKSIVRVGNSAGVILPREWLHGEARVELVRRPIDPQRELLELLGAYLPSVLGVYLVGSYARHEQTVKSDVDALIITKDIDKKLKEGKYEVLLVSERTLERELQENALPLLPMLKEALPIMNAQLIEKYQKMPLTRRNVSWHFETTRSALRVAKASFALSEEGYISDRIMYSLVLRLREASIVDALMRNKVATTSGLKALIRKVTGSLAAYEAYQRSKAEEKAQQRVPIEQAKALYDYLEQQIKEQEQWIGKKG